MREEYIKTIRDVCVAANPEIMELKFGCEVRTKNSPAKVVFVLGHFAENTYRLAWIDKTGVFEFYGKDTELNIIGRPIRLADVLYAIDHNNEDNPPALTSEGQFCQYEPETGVMHLSGEYWNLLHDSVTDQETPTLKFLAELLGDYKRAVTNQ